MVKKKTIKETPSEKYSKEQLTRSKKYVKYIDLLNATLKDGEYYTIDEVDTFINDYMKGKVID